MSLLQSFFFLATSTMILMSTARISCQCFLMGYSALTTLTVIALAAIMGHQGTTCIDPIIEGNEGEVAVMNENIVNVDFFNSHTEKVADTKALAEGTCDQTCSHFFSGLEVGEIISFILLGVLTLRFWGQISMWCLNQFREMRKSVQSSKTAKME